MVEIVGRNFILYIYIYIFYLPGKITDLEILFGSSEMFFQILFPHKI